MLLRRRPDDIENAGEVNTKLAQNTKVHILSGGWSSSMVCVRSGGL